MWAHPEPGHVTAIARFSKIADHDLLCAVRMTVETWQRNDDHSEPAR